MGCYLLVWKWFHDFFSQLNRGRKELEVRIELMAILVFYTALNDFTGLEAIFFKH